MSSYHKKRGEDKACSNCGKVTYKRPSELAKNKSGKFFCSNQCQQDHEWDLKVEKAIKFGIDSFDITQKSKHRLAKSVLAHIHPHGKTGYACQICGYEAVNNYTKGNKNSRYYCHKVITELHHIDGNPNNNSLDNIMITCANHHREMPFWGSNGQGGRKYGYVNNLTHG
jgi:hypothetical protein